MSWSTTFTDPYGNGSPTTLDHYRLFDSPDGSSVTVLVDNLTIPSNLSGSLDISSLGLPAGSHMLYLKLVGKPGIFNKLSAPMPAHTVSLAKSGRDTVGSSSAALSCGARCSGRRALHRHGAQITLTARALTGTRFVGWSGACSGTAPTCTVTVDAARSVTATFP